jgi:hypothetical protein
MGPHPRRVEGSDYYWSLPTLLGVTRAGSHSLTGYCLHSHTHTHTFMILLLKYRNQYKYAMESIFWDLIKSYERWESKVKRMKTERELRSIKFEVVRNQEAGAINWAFWTHSSL